ncbi:AMP-binding protein [Mycolicibacterium brumae]|uniref:Acyl--CoA ligase n=1 Tax=Mycolicibacterium brumae TaxID=85968 RepID=A0A2G5PI56_9MYCO|nr:AMP-binding protein [Mycolicibacterium brumae]MCV7194490.1 AMP-binding protein [Mycolicibacterium brumae]PIB77703.1 acyl--CoA ligase [Mycolicibacterium brumae]RWA20097.1 hypothetical protein MBRU_15805 [Mycolicibacterium brumae DSM 44177]UWW10025.1 AMP-binding protein [Mycolicibacterium brumae]
MAHGIADRAQSDPDAIAISDGGVELSWRQLNQRLNRLVNLLLSLDIPAGERIAVLGENSAHTAVAHLGVTYAGASAVPVNYHLTADEVGYILADANARTVLCSARAADTARAAAPDARVLAWGDNLEELLAESSVSEPSARIAPAKPLYYTSGTTGRPKGVRLPDQMFPAGRSIAEMVANIAASPMRSAGRHLVVAPMHHTGPLVGVRSMMAGTPVVVLPKFDAEQTLAVIETHRVEATMMVPTHFSRLLALPAELRGRYDVSSLRSVVHTGAACPVPVKRAMIDWFGPILNEAYGSTEIGTLTMIGSAEWLEHPGSVGRALPGYELTIRDESGAALGPGAEGLVCARPLSGPGPSYHGDPEKTRRSHLGDGSFIVGEIGYLDDDGYLYLTDRASDLVVSGGVNVYPAESEAVLRTHPGVADVAVIGVPHDDLGEQLCALVQPAADTQVSADELVAWTRDRLAHYKCPNIIEFTEGEIRTAMGKLDKRRLRREHLERAAARS